MGSSWRPLMFFVRWGAGERISRFQCRIHPSRQAAGRRQKKSPGSGAGAGMHVSDCRGGGLQLPILSQHFAARVAHAPAMRGERRATAEQVAPGHAAGAVTQPRRRRLAGREFGEIDGAGTRGPYADKKARG